VQKCSPPLDPGQDLLRVAAPGRTNQVERAVIYSNNTNADETIEVDAVIASLGFLSTSGRSRDGARTGARQHPGQHAHGDQLRGVYGLGHRHLPGKVKLIATGFGEAATAVNNAAAYLNPKASVFPGHSSSQDVARQVQGAGRERKPGCERISRHGATARHCKTVLRADRENPDLVPRPAYTTRYSPTRSFQ